MRQFGSLFLSTASRCRFRLAIALSSVQFEVAGGLSAFGGPIRPGFGAPFRICNCHGINISPRSSALAGGCSRSTARYVFAAAIVQIVDCINANGQIFGEFHRFLVLRSTSSEIYTFWIA